MADLLEYVDKDTSYPGFEVTLGYQSLSSTSTPTHSIADMSSQDTSVVSSLLMLASKSEKFEQVSMALLDQLVISSETVESPLRIYREYDP